MRGDNCCLLSCHFVNCRKTGEHSNDVLARPNQQSIPCPHRTSATLPRGLSPTCPTMEPVVTFTIDVFFYEWIRLTRRQQLKTDSQHIRVGFSLSSSRICSQRCSLKKYLHALVMRWPVQEARNRAALGLPQQHHSLVSVQMRGEVKVPDAGLHGVAC